LLLLGRDWYSVTLSAKVVAERVYPDDDARSPRMRGKLASRHDVRAHDVVYVKRGKLPLSKADAARLRCYGSTKVNKLLVSKLSEAFDASNRRYKVWTDEQPDEETRYYLRARGHSDRRADAEWLAVRVVRKLAHMKGPEGAPYRPAVRVLPDVEPVA
jgi:hypothetical protein